MFIHSDEEFCQGDSEQPQTPTKYEQNAHILTYSTARIQEQAQFSKGRESDRCSTSERDSFDRSITHGNVLSLKKACQQFHKCFSIEDEQETGKERNRNFFDFSNKNNSEEVDKAGDILTINNPLLTKEGKAVLLQVISQRQEVRDLLLQIQQQFTSKVAQQLAFVISTLLMHKFQNYQSLCEENSLPNVPRFNGILEDDGKFSSGWDVYEDLEYKTIQYFATEDIDKIASQLYSSQKLKEMFSQRLHSQLQISSKFAILMTFVSESLFLTLSGISLPDDALRDLVYELSLSEGHGRCQNNRKMKKMKFE